MAVLLTDRFLLSEAFAEDLMCRLFVWLVRRCDEEGQVLMEARKASQFFGVNEYRLNKAITKLHRLGFVTASGREYIRVRVIDHESYAPVAVKPPSKRKPNPAKEEAFQRSLKEAIAWWNGMHDRGIVHSRVQEDPVGKGVTAAWKRVQKDAELRECYSHRQEIEAAIRRNEFLRKASWLRFERLFGRNQDRVWVAKKIIEGGYNGDGLGFGRGRSGTPMPATAGQGSDASAGRAF